jgi:hypothetical protein
MHKSMKRDQQDFNTADFNPSNYDNPSYVTKRSNTHSHSNGSSSNSSNGSSSSKSSTYAKRNHNETRRYDNDSSIDSPRSFPQQNNYSPSPSSSPSMYSSDSLSNKLFSGIIDDRPSSSSSSSSSFTNMAGNSRLNYKNEQYTGKKNQMTSHNNNNNNNNNINNNSKPVINHLNNARQQQQQPQQHQYQPSIKSVSFADDPSIIPDSPVRYGTAYNNNNNNNNSVTNVHSFSRPPIVPNNNINNNNINNNTSVYHQTQTQVPFPQSVLPNVNLKSILAMKETLNNQKISHRQSLLSAAQSHTRHAIRDRIKFRFLRHMVPILQEYIISQDQGDEEDTEVTFKSKIKELTQQNWNETQARECIQTLTKKFPRAIMYAELLLSAEVMVYENILPGTGTGTSLNALNQSSTLLNQSTQLNVNVNVNEMTTEEDINSKLAASQWVPLLLPLVAIDPYKFFPCLIEITCKLCYNWANGDTFSDSPWNIEGLEKVCLNAIDETIDRFIPTPTVSIVSLYKQYCQKQFKMARIQQDFTYLYEHRAQWIETAKQFLDKQSEEIKLNEKLQSDSLLYDLNTSSNNNNNNNNDSLYPLIKSIQQEALPYLVQMTQAITRFTEHQKLVLESNKKIEQLITLFQNQNLNHTTAAPTIKTENDNSISNHNSGSLGNTINRYPHNNSNTNTNTNSNTTNTNNNTNNNINTNINSSNNNNLKDTNTSAGPGISTANPTQNTHSHSSSGASTPNASIKPSTSHPVTKLDEEIQDSKQFNRSRYVEVLKQYYPPTI